MDFKVPYIFSFLLTLISIDTNIDNEKSNTGYTLVSLMKSKLYLESFTIPACLEKWHSLLVPMLFWGDESFIQHYFFYFSYLFYLCSHCLVFSDVKKIVGTRGELILVCLILVAVSWRFSHSLILSAYNDDNSPPYWHFLLSIFVYTLSCFLVLTVTLLIECYFLYCICIFLCEGWWHRMHFKWQSFSTFGGQRC